MWAAVTIAKVLYDALSRNGKARRNRDKGSDEPKDEKSKDGT